MRGTANGTNWYFAPPYSIIFMADLEERILKDIELKPCMWWRYIDDKFFMWEHREDYLKQFIKFTAEWSK